MFMNPSLIHAGAVMMNDDKSVHLWESLPYHCVYIFIRSLLKCKLIGYRLQVPIFQMLYCK